MRFGICDMEASFVPRTGNQMAMPDDDWYGRSGEERLGTALRIIAESPFDFVELGIPWINDGPGALPAARVESLLAEHELRVGAYNSFIPPDMPVVGPAVRWADVRAYVENVFENCARLGGSLVVFGSGDSRVIPPGYSRDAAVDDVRRFLTMCVEVVAERGYPLRVALESLNTDECNFINSIGEGRDVVEGVDDTVGLLLDCYHLGLQDGDYWADLERSLDRVIHVQIVEPMTRRRPGFSASPDFDYTRLVRLLRDSGYAGDVSVEAIFEDLAGEIAPCHEFLTTVFA